LRVTQLKEKYQKIKEKKIQTSIEELCKDLPIQFADYLRKTRELQFT
jgi:casein kinase 1